MLERLGKITLACGIATALMATTAMADMTCETKIIDKCTGCHYQTRICEKIGQKSRRGWKVTVKRMLRYGLQLNSSEQEGMLDCLQSLEKDSGTLCR